MHMHQRIEAKDEIDRPSRNHRETVSLIKVIVHLRILAEPLPASFHALPIRIDQVEVVAMLP